MDRMADLAYDRSKRAREHEHIMQEDGGVKVRVEISAWEEVVVFDAVGPAGAVSNTFFTPVDCKCLPRPSSSFQIPVLSITNASLIP